MGKRRSKSPRKWKYQLSIGIIFKNEIRCLERCLTSLLPLRKSISFEIVMADTGSTDGSREIAEKYADILFDFPWINDFAAARNAVLERCSGEWFFYIDCDEWLEDFTPLTRFLNGKPNAAVCGAMVTQRSYRSYSGEGKNQFKNAYADLLVYRMVRMSAKPHFESAIHEYLVTERPESRIAPLQSLILHHDGYVSLNDGSAEGDEKRRRNVKLLRIELERNPDDLSLWIHLLNVGEKEADYYDLLRQAVSLVTQKAQGWQDCGPLIFSRVVWRAWRGGLPELQDWAEQAETLFPDSYHTRIDVSAVLCHCANAQRDFSKSLRYGRAYLAARAELSRNPLAMAQSTVYGSFIMNYEEEEKKIRLFVIRAVVHVGEMPEVLKSVRELRRTLESEPEAMEWVPTLSEEIRQREEREKRTPPTPTVSPELRELAEKVRAILAAYPPDDPAVVALKATPAYQKVAHLL